MTGVYVRGNAGGTIEENFILRSAKVGPDHVIDIMGIA